MSTKTILYAMLLLAITFTSPTIARPTVIDRVVAYVGDKAITQRELDTAHDKIISTGLQATRIQTLDTLINRILIVNEALKLRMQGENADELIHEYIDHKIRPFVTIIDADIAQHFKDNRLDYPNASFDSIKEKIRILLEEKEVNTRLKDHIRKMRKNTIMRIMPD